MVIVGHQKQLEFLERTADSGRRGHAYVLSGPAKIGKKKIAFEWLSRMFKEKIYEGCAHPDFLFVEPLTDAKTGKKSGEITVDQIRGIIRKLSLKPAMAGVKAAIIDDAHLMNTEAQNCLLKTLEEPPGDSLIILVAQNQQRLLETIRSRCEVLQFNFVSEAQIESSAKEFTKSDGAKLDAAAVKEIVKLSFGRPGRMMEFLADETRINKWRQAEKEFARIVNAELPEKFAYVKKITEDENSDIAAALEVWQFYFRNMMLDVLSETASAKSAKVAPCKLARCDLDQAAPKFVFSKIKEAPYTLEKIAAILKKIHDLNVTLMTTNANTKLAIENFMIDI
jgi:DNA polymerase-3 subunit delta'